MRGFQILICRRDKNNEIAARCDEIRARSDEIFDIGEPQKTRSTRFGEPLLQPQMKLTPPPYPPKADFIAKRFHPPWWIYSALADLVVDAIP